MEIQLLFRHRNAAAILGLVLSACPALATPQAFQAGLKDREAFEQWFASLPPMLQKGAAFWANERDHNKPDKCLSVQQESSWLQGCLEAQKRLTLMDQRRNADRDYRAGWNSFSPSTSVQSAPEQSTLPPTTTTLTAEYCHSLRTVGDGQGEHMREVNDCLRAVANARMEAGRLAEQQRLFERQQQEMALRVAQAEQREQARQAFLQQQQEQEQQQREAAQREQQRLDAERATREREQAERVAQQKKRVERGVAEALARQQDQVSELEFPPASLDSKLMVRGYLGDYTALTTLRVFISLLLDSGEYTNVERLTFSSSPDLIGFSFKREGSPTSDIILRQDGNELYVFGSGEGGRDRRLSDGDLFSVGVALAGAFGHLSEVAAARVHL